MRQYVSHPDCRAIQPLAMAEFTTLWVRLIKMAAQIVETASRVHVAFAATHPEAALFARLARWPAANPATRTGCREPGQGGEDAEHKATRGAGRVDPAGQHLEANSFGAQHVYEFNDVAE